MPGYMSQTGTWKAEGGGRDEAVLEPELLQRRPRFCWWVHQNPAPKTHSILPCEQPLRLPHLSPVQRPVIRRRLGSSARSLLILRQSTQPPLSSLSPPLLCSSCIVMPRAIEPFYCSANMALDFPCPDQPPSKSARPAPSQTAAMHLAGGTSKLLT